MKRVVIRILATLGVAASALVVVPATGRSEINLPAINQTMQHQNELLLNHEARITNLEGDVKAVQVNTDTQATVHEDVPPVVTPVPEPAPTEVSDPPAEQGPVVVTVGNPPRSNQ